MKNPGRNPNFSWNCFFWTRPFNASEENAKMQSAKKVPSVPRSVMRSDIIWTSSRDAIFDFVFSPTLPKAARHWAMGVGGEGGGHGRHAARRPRGLDFHEQRLGLLEAWWQTTTTPPPAGQRSSVPAVSAPFPFPIPRFPSPGTTPPRLPHLSMSQTLHSHTRWKSCPLLLELMFPWPGPSFSSPLHRHQIKPTSTRQRPEPTPTPTPAPTPGQHVVRRCIRPRRVRRHASRGRMPRRVVSRAMRPRRGREFGARSTARDCCVSGTLGSLLPVALPPPPSPTLAAPLRRRARR